MHTGTHPGLAAVAVPPAHHGPRQDDGGGPDAGADVRPGGPPHAAGGAPRPAPARTPPVGFPTSRGGGGPPPPPPGGPDRPWPGPRGVLPQRDARALLRLHPQARGGCSGPHPPQRPQWGNPWRKGGATIAEDVSGIGPASLYFYAVVAGQTEAGILMFRTIVARLFIKEGRTLGGGPWVLWVFIVLKAQGPQKWPFSKKITWPRPGPKPDPPPRKRVCQLCRRPIAQSTPSPLVVETEPGSGVHWVWEIAPRVIYQIGMAENRIFALHFKDFSGSITNAVFFG